MRLLFLHGAGGYDEDRALATDLAGSLDASLDFPELPGEDMSLAAWAAVIRPALASLSPDDRVIAHSFGATALLWVLHEDRVAVSADLLAMPDWSPAGWDVSEYDVPTSASASLTLHHCRDDEVVEFSHMGLHAARMPSAQVRAYLTGGHQFEGQAAEIAAG